MTPEERKLMQDVYIRVCKDSGFLLNASQAAIFAAKIIECHPLEIWLSLDFDLMNRIASGEHPACNRV